MNIRVRYTMDLRQALRMNLYLRRKAMAVLSVLGAILIVLAVLRRGAETGTSVALFVAIGVLLMAEVPGMTWLLVRRDRHNLEGVQVTLTNKGINQRTAAANLNVTWGMIERTHEGRDLWVFVVDRIRRIAVPKEALTPEQQAELAAFVAARQPAKVRSAHRLLRSPHA